MKDKIKSKIITAIYSQYGKPIVNIENIVDFALKEIRQELRKEIYKEIVEDFRRYKGLSQEFKDEAKKRYNIDFTN